MTVTILEPMGNTEISVDMFDPFGWAGSTVGLGATL